MEIKELSSRGFFIDDELDLEQNFMSNHYYYIHAARLEIMRPIQKKITHANFLKCN